MASPPGVAGRCSMPTASAWTRYWRRFASCTHAAASGGSRHRCWKNWPLKVGHFRAGSPVSNFVWRITMNVNYTAEELAFRDEVRAFLESELPADIAAKTRLGKHLSKEDHQRWQQILVRRGWYAPGWPVELGGTTWGPVEKHIFDEE